MKLIDKAQEEENREYAFRFLFRQKYPQMDKKNFKSFKEFWEEIQPKTTTYDLRNKDEIMQEILDIENKQEKGGK